MNIRGGIRSSILSSPSGTSSCRCFYKLMHQFGCKSRARLVRFFPSSFNSAQPLGYMLGACWMVTYGLIVLKMRRAAAYPVMDGTVRLACSDWRCVRIQGVQFF